MEASTPCPDLISLAQLGTGLSARVCQLNSNKEVSARLHALGIRPGQDVQIIRSAAFSGPLHVRAGQTDIILRRSEAQNIQVRFQI